MLCHCCLFCNSAYRPEFKKQVKSFAEFLFKPERIVVKKALNVAIRSAEIVEHFKVHSGVPRTLLTHINVDLH